MTWIDLIVIAFIALSGVLAMMRGFVQEFLSIIAWIIAGIATLQLFPFVYPFLDGLLSPPWLAALVAALGIFVILLVVLSLIAYRFSQRMRGTVVGPLDRSGGFLFGLIRGLLLVTIPYIILVKYLEVPENLPPENLAARAQPFVARSSEILLALVPSNENTPMQAKKRPSAPKKKTPETTADSDDGTGYKASERKSLDQLIKTLDDK